MDSCIMLALIMVSAAIYQTDWREENVFAGAMLLE